MSYSREDVETHYDHGNRRPAVNVKVYIPYRDSQWVELARMVATDEGHTDPEEIDSLCDYVSDWANQDSPADWPWEHALESGWEMLESDAKEIFADYRVKVWSEGRSGGWCVVDGLPELEDWDAVLLAKWRRFERYAKAEAADIPRAMVWTMMANGWEHVRKVEEDDL